MYSDFDKISPICQKTLCPFNIRDIGNNHWLGSHGTYKGFVRFDSFELGIRAGLRLLATYIRKGYTNTRSIIERYAPAFENNSKDYLHYVNSSFDRYGVSASDIRVGSDAFFVLARAIAIYETRCVIDFDYLHYVYDKWKI